MNLPRFYLSLVDRSLKCYHFNSIFTSCLFLLPLSRFVWVKLSYRFSMFHRREPTRSLQQTKKKPWNGEKEWDLILGACLFRRSVSLLYDRVFDVVFLSRFQSRRRLSHPTRFRHRHFLFFLIFRHIRESNHHPFIQPSIGWSTNRSYRSIPNPDFANETIYSFRLTLHRNSNCFECSFPCQNKRKRMRGLLLFVSVCWRTETYQAVTLAVVFVHVFVHSLHNTSVRW